MTNSTNLIKNINPNDKESWFESVFITMDFDWAIDEVLLYSIKLLEEYECSSTFFITNTSPLIENINNNNQFELGIHPNFNFLLEGDFRYGKNIDEVIDYYLNMVPDAQSARSHSLASSTPILNALNRKGVKFDCNTFIPFQGESRNVEPFLLWIDGMVRIPHFWEDNVNLLKFKQKYSVNQILSSEGLKVFDFHPIHIFLNSSTIEHYEMAKKHYSDIDKLLTYVNKESYGVKDFFLELINTTTSK